MERDHRPLRPDELPAAAALVVSSFRGAYGEMLAPRALDAMTVEYLLAEWSSGPQLIGLFHDEVLVGVTRIGAHPEDPSAGHLFSLYVSPEHQRQGLGKALLDVATAALERDGFRRATLWVFDGNEPAKALYARNGWLPTGQARVEDVWAIPQREMQRDLVPHSDETWMTEVLQELQDWIRIPSIGADPAHAWAMQAGADWTRRRLRAFCPEVEFVDTGAPGPLVIARVAASKDAANAPTYLIYGHYDVQPAGSGWSTEAFVPIIRDGWIYGRGASDDKGQFLALIKAVEILVRRSQLPVNIVFLADGAEETLGEESSVWLRDHHDGLTGAILFDSSFLDEQTPVINTSTRGLVKFEVVCRTGARDLHSGLAGGAARNAFHELVALVHAWLPRNGLLPAAVMRNAIPATEAEIVRWSSLVSGASLLEAQGGQPADATAASEYYLRTWARPSLDIHAFRTPAGDVSRTAVISEATVTASIRVAPGQTPAQMIAFLDSSLEQARTQTGADLELVVLSQTSPSFMSEDSPLLRAGLRAFEQVWGITPQFLRAGGTLPFVATLTEMQIPFLLSGLHLPEGNAHGPDEALKLAHLYDGVRLVIALLEELAES